MGQGCIGVKVEPQLGRLDADLDVKAAGHDLVEDVVVVIRHDGGLIRALPALTEVREEQGDAQRTELLGRLEGVLHLLARHERRYPRRAHIRRGTCSFSHRLRAIQSRIERMAVLI